MNIKVLTLFPDVIKNFLDHSIYKRGIDNNLFSVECIDIRNYSKDSHKSVDDYTFGGGPGMVMAFQPIDTAIIENSISQNPCKIYMSPRGETLDYDILKEFSKEEEIVILCGHYEGVDERVLEKHSFREISIGDYILTGGEVASLVLIDSLCRFLPDVISNDESIEEESIYSGLLEYPQYTRPQLIDGLCVPDVLLSGNHENIRLWRFRKALEKTYFSRRDLFNKFMDTAFELDKPCKKVLKGFLKEKGIDCYEEI